MSRSIKVLVCAGIALTTLTATSPHAQEARCAELGADCVCSEPLQDAREGVALRSGHDFADSPDATECNRHGEFLDTNIADMSTVAESGMPPANTVDRVMANPGNGGDILWLYDALDPQPDEARRCWRYHFMVSKDYSGVGEEPVPGCLSGRNKLMQVTVGGAAHQVQERADSMSCTGPNAGPPPASAPYRELVFSFLGPPHDSNYFYSPSLDFSACQEGVGWCALETCLGGDLDAGRDLTIQSRITTLSDRQVHEIRKVGPWSGEVLSGSLNGADIYHGPSSAPNSGNGVGTIWVSHWMVASWPHDAGQWIGPACEVTGGCPAD